MTTKSKSIRLAELLEKKTWPMLEEQYQAATELRRLQSQRDLLLEALRDMVSDHASLSAATLEFARAAIAQAEE